MAMFEKKTVTLFKLDRLKNSVNGNPTWNLDTSAGMYRTGTDSNVGRRLGGFYEGKEVVLTLDRGYVIGIDVA